MATITVASGDWRDPVFTQENKEAYYARMRKPLGGVQGHADPTTASLTEKLSQVGKYSMVGLVRSAMRSEFELTTGYTRLCWFWAMGYVVRERLADWRASVAIGSSVVELTSDLTRFEELRQEMLDIEESLDLGGDDIQRADARRAIMDYFNVRSYIRITGGGNMPSVIYEGDPLNTLAAGGSWIGLAYEIGLVAFPELERRYDRISMIDKLASLTNAIASIARDQREETTNALIPVYTQLGGDLAADLAAVCTYIENTDGAELSVLAHFVAAHSIHSRYIMLGIFLAAARLGKISLTARGVQDTWEKKSVSFSKRMAVPEGCVSTSQEDREKHIVHAISYIWVQVQHAERQGTDSAIGSAQRALHKFVDEEAQGISWKRVDPVVMWAVIAGFFVSMVSVDGMAGLLLRGESFKSLHVESEGFEDVWLQEIFSTR
ncbi:hypothetical protein BGZ63DRAFT_382567 [Mariannaea sp. PMI_226]|nr:hypothetical protein BGZ63DRAFT_382567 [Mariannaea sp. PMI_226]